MESIFIRIWHGHEAPALRFGLIEFGSDNGYIMAGFSGRNIVRFALSRNLSEGVIAAQKFPGPTAL